jgi:hypothetical protein
MDRVYPRVGFGLLDARWLTVRESLVRPIEKFVSQSPLLEQRQRDGQLSHDFPELASAKLQPERYCALAW